MFELASLQDSNLKSKKKFTEHLEDIDKRYGKLYMQFLKEVLIDEFKDSAKDKVIPYKSDLSTLIF